MGLKKIAQTCAEDTADWFPRFQLGAPSIHHLIALAGEAGEVMDLVKKWDRESINATEFEEKLRGELADVFIYLVNAANEMGFNLEELYWEKREYNQRRFGARNNHPSVVATRGIHGAVGSTPTP